MGKNPSILQGKETDPEVLKELDECLKQNKVFEGQTVNYTASK